MSAAVGGAAGQIDSDRVARLMGVIARGHGWAIWELRDIADPPIRTRLRAELRRLDVRYDADDLDGMVNEAVLEIVKVAGAWRTGGAPPWSWAHHRIVGVVHRFVGVFARSLDQVATTADLVERGPVVVGRSADDDLATGPRLALQRLAASRSEAHELEAALSDLVSRRDSAVWLAVECERAVGNRHPAVTVGARFGMTDSNVRKVVQRVRQCLVGAISDGSYPALARLAVFADRVSADRVSAAA